MPNYLLMRLEAPMQSWGDRSQWPHKRDTCLYPTKSGVAGLLACALGMSRDAIYTIAAQIEITVRVDRRGRLEMDFRTVGAGIGVRAADGRVKDTNHIMDVYYLADASFVVAVQASAEMVERMATALLDPVWPYYLGQKAFVPAEPIYISRGEFANDLEALRHVEPSWRHDPNMVMVVNSRPGVGSFAYDNVVGPGVYAPRYIQELSYELA